MTQPETNPRADAGVPEGDTAPAAAGTMLADVEAYPGRDLAAEFDDADLTHPLAAHRIPALRSPHPRWNYHVAVMVPTGEARPLWGESLEPDEVELRQLAAYLDFRLQWYREGYRKQMVDRHPFDVDGGVNTFVFRKHPDIGWQYHARSWTMHLWFPQQNLHPERYESLAALLDKVAGHGSDPNPRWEEFKAGSDAFPG